ncbi:MAG TPA: TolC family protein [Chthonomonadales bacterium]|nr:TolC family protein [Chthonomonadales bacterium]
MRHQRDRCAMLAVALAVLAVPLRAQTPGPSSLTPDDAVRMAVENSPAVAAARSRLEAAEAEVRGARAPYGLRAEIAPGAGFTGSNALLSHRLDIGGRRAAATHLASAGRDVEQALLIVTRQQVAFEALTAYHDLARAQADVRASEEAVALARQIRDAVRQRVELGQAPAIQGTRADIEVARAEQEAVRARGQARGRQAALNLLLGRGQDAGVAVADALPLPAPPAPPDDQVRHALQQRPELAASRARAEARRGEAAVARAQGRPDLLAEVPADVWSLDRRDALHSRNLGFQLRVGLPLWRDGALRGEEQRAQAAVRAEEGERMALERAIAREVEQAAAELAAARDVALQYEQTILPRTRELLAASRAGFESGLTSYVDVLEAQRVTRLAQMEYQDALFDALRARLALDRATGNIPGLPDEPAHRP